MTHILIDLDHCDACYEAYFEKRFWEIVEAGE